MVAKVALLLESLGVLVTAAAGGRGRAFRPRYVEPTRFALTEVQDAKKHLELYGFVVYREVLSSVEAATGLNLLWDFLEGVGGGISRQAPGSLWQQQLQEFFGNGIVASCGVGQADAAWFVRGKPQVRAAFSSVWGTDDLLSSFDGAVIFRRNDTALGDKGTWYHVDLNPLRWQGDYMPMVQGYLSLMKGTEAGGGPVLVMGSHRMYQTFTERYSPALQEWKTRFGYADHYMNFMQNDELVVPELDAAAIVAHLEAGDLLIWDSRTVHCNVGPMRAEGGNDASAALDKENLLARAGMLLTMQPRQGVSDAVLAARQEALCTGVTTTHWPKEFVPTDQPLGGTRWQDQVVPCRYAGPSKFLDENCLELVGMSAAQRAEWLSRGVAERCGGREYPRPVPAQAAVWSNPLS
eukprot:TRINITY_DN10719_c1_g1_i1.p1 TRINITY_DN10719_c1_g1~~TRINITY_DN10719_c1_g1_i1.p1  ORF type:complete len:408 (+),score=97.88 TRINITY_DN10719_c1_g1_i1:244-1467(+)